MGWNRYRRESPPLPPLKGVGFPCCRQIDGWSPPVIPAKAGIQPPLPLGAGRGEGDTTFLTAACCRVDSPPLPGTMRFLATDSPFPLGRGLGVGPLLHRKKPALVRSRGEDYPAHPCILQILIQTKNPPLSGASVEVTLYSPLPTPPEAAA